MANDDNQDAENVKRRTYLQGVAAAGGAVTLGGLASSSASAQPEEIQISSAAAVYCGQFSSGAQVQQCLACVEARCEGNAYPVGDPVRSLSGSCFTPSARGIQIPEDADWITLKAGQNCYVAPVDNNTTFCLPPGAPDISNATFYRCGGDPRPILLDYEVTCETLTVTTRDVPDETTVTATVTFRDADGVESEEEFTETIQNDVATFGLPGDLNPINLVLSIGTNGTQLADLEIIAEDYPCTPEPPEPPEPLDPRIADLEATCEAITITTEDIEENEMLYVTVGFEGGLEETYNVPVGSNGVATVPLSGEFTPLEVTVVYDNEKLYDALVPVLDGPCSEEPPEPPKETKKKRKKKLKRKKRKYERAKREYEKYEKKHQKGNVSKADLEQKKRAYERAKRKYDRYKKKSEQRS